MMKARELRANPGVPGMTLCRRHLTAPLHAPHNVHAGLPRAARWEHLSQLRGRPPLVPSAWSQPSSFPPRDHADGATLGRQGRPRRPEPTEPDRDRGRNRGSIRGRDRSSGRGRVSDRGRGSIRYRNRIRERGLTRVRRENDSEETEGGANPTLRRTLDRRRRTRRPGPILPTARL